VNATLHADSCIANVLKYSTRRNNFIDGASVLQFKRLLNRELHQFSGTSHAGTEISEYICNTFLGKRASLLINDSL